jgi:hypothetical protein
MSNRDIKADPNKIKAIQAMSTPHEWKKSVKISMTFKLLARFIS